MKLNIIFVFFISVYLNCFADEKININFKELQLEELLKITTKILDKNIFIDHPISGKVNFISNKPVTKNELMEILKLSLNSKGYELLEDKGILKVVKKQKKEDLPKKEIETEVIYLKNSDAKTITDILINFVKNDKSKIKISFDKDQNIVIIKGLKSKVKGLKELIKKLDVKKQQVYVKAKIIEISEQKSKELGIKYGLLAGRSDSSGLLTMAADLGGDPIAFSPSSIGLSIPSINEGVALAASINILNQNGAANIISEPSLLCINNKESSIYVGETRSIKIASSTSDSGKVNDTFKREDIGLTLKVKPRISSKDKVILEISTVLEDITQTTTNGQPNTTKKDLLTTAIVNNGESVILGGYIKEKSFSKLNSIPILGDIPVLGLLFQNKDDLKDKINLVIIVTPYIVPQTKDLTFIRSQLSKLSSLEEQYTKKIVSRLKEK